ncbi:MAG: L-rhamnose mutarotase [Solirubrobacteraceae bacterium]
MELAGLRGRLQPGAADAYQRAHDQIPEGVLEAQRTAGVRRWLIFRDGLDLFHVAECENFDDSMRALARDPVDQAWQRQMTPYKEPLGDRGNTERRIQLIYQRDLWLP